MATLSTAGVPLARVASTTYELLPPGSTWPSSIDQSSSSSFSSPGRACNHSLPAGPRLSIRARVSGWSRTCPRAPAETGASAADGTDVGRTYELRVLGQHPAPRRTLGWRPGGPALGQLRLVNAQLQ